MLPRILLFLLLPLVVCSGVQAQNPPTYEYSADALTRMFKGQSQEIGCTDPEGPGTIHGLARSPLGTTYVIAENGLYSLSDKVTDLTPLPLKSGAPAGVPRGIQVDDLGVIWLATDAGFGPVEPVHLFGRVLAPGAFSGLSKSADGTLHAQSAAGTFEYRPGAESPPVVRVESADPAPIDGVQHVRLASTTRGPALYAYRISYRYRYLTQSAAAFEIRDLEPGRQELMFAVYDQDMQRSADVRVVLQVPYPKTFSKAVAVPTILALGAGLLLVLLNAARRRGGGRTRYTKALLSAFIGSVVGLQILAGIIPHAKGWPFVGFSMYSGTFAPGSHTYKGVVHAIYGQGFTRRILPASAGYLSDGAWQALIPLVYGDDETRQRFVDAYNKRQPGMPIYGIVVSDQKHRLTALGPIAVAPIVMRVYPEGALDAR